MWQIYYFSIHSNPILDAGSSFDLARIIPKNEFSIIHFGLVFAK